MEGSVISQGMVVEEHARGDVEGNEHIDGVVFVGGQHKEHSEHVQDP